MLVPALPFQFVHEEDVGRALLQCVVAAGPPGAYNIAADGILAGTDVAREFGLLALPLPAAPVQIAARAVTAIPFLLPVAEWVEAASHPAIMDTTRGPAGPGLGAAVHRDRGTPGHPAAKPGTGLRLPLRALAQGRAGAGAPAPLGPARDMRGRRR